MEQTETDAEKWVELIKQYSNPTERTTELLNTLIKKIVVHEAVKGTDGVCAVSQKRAWDDLCFLQPAWDVQGESLNGWITGVYEMERGYMMVCRCDMQQRYAMQK